MIFRNDFLEYFWDRHRAAEPFDNFSWAFLATNFNQEDHWFEGFPPPKNWAVLGVFWVKCCYYWSQQSWLPPVPFLQKIPYLDTMENHWTNVFFFSKNILGISIFFYIFDMAESNSTIFPVGNMFTSNKPLTVATTCWPEFLCWKLPDWCPRIPGRSSRTWGFEGRWWRWWRWWNSRQ